LDLWVGAARAETRTTPPDVAGWRRRAVLGLAALGLRSSPAHPATSALRAVACSQALLFETSIS
jgi:hypothetical protein